MPHFYLTRSQQRKKPTQPESPFYIFKQEYQSQNPHLSLHQVNQEALKAYECLNDDDKIKLDHQYQKALKEYEIKTQEWENLNREFNQYEKGLQSQDEDDQSLKSLSQGSEKSHFSGDESQSSDEQDEDWDDNQENEQPTKQQQQKSSENPVRKRLLKKNSQKNNSPLSENSNRSSSPAREGKSSPEQKQSPGKKSSKIRQSSKGKQSTGRQSPGIKSSQGKFQEKQSPGKIQGKGREPQKKSKKQLIQQYDIQLSQQIFTNDIQRLYDLISTQNGLQKWLSKDVLFENNRVYIGIWNRKIFWNFTHIELDKNSISLTCKDFSNIQIFNTTLKIFIDSDNNVVIHHQGFKNQDKYFQKLIQIYQVAQGKLKELVEERKFNDENFKSLGEEDENIIQFQDENSDVEDEDYQPQSQSQSQATESEDDHSKQDEQKEQQKQKEQINISQKKKGRKPKSSNKKKGNQSENKQLNNSLKKLII
ncbi:hypothetical protein IMG5_204100 [Ichthyophthirius multifiliis]|uniref:Uncharacterized protein n=1 Tax=Ichthyophthirius multifiliis TaxID=5932 RepID=G0R6E1_ICHMU|nr:hypothetical protein IMG5_204100 [Ichthyophthirius multifiliis]EGR26959.1 hypothetical protein IMG5_204100 [Ichthyophthirius multifiliis]|eukprot:XP_004023843.1 hypothetical protein IMG5_204100 [Ichthyophthirius multifiliis]